MHAILLLQIQVFKTIYHCFQVLDKRYHTIYVFYINFVTMFITIFCNLFLSFIRDNTHSSHLNSSVTNSSSYNYVTICHSPVA